MGMGGPRELGRETRGWLATGNERKMSTTRLVCVPKPAFGKTPLDDREIEREKNKIQYNQSNHKSRYKGTCWGS